MSSAESELGLAKQLKLAKFQVALLQEELNQERKIKWESSVKMVSQVILKAQDAETRAERAERKVAVLEEEKKKLEEALSEAPKLLQESVERSSTFLVTEKKRVSAENEETEKKRFKVGNENLLITNKHVEGVKSAANKCVVNEDITQPAVRAASATVSLHHDNCSHLCNGRCRSGGRPMPAQTLAPAVGKSVGNKLTEVQANGSLVSNRHTKSWNFVDRCWEGAFCNHPKPCFQVKCPIFEESAPAGKNCRAIMHLANLKKHMQKVHSSQEYNLCCPACGVEVSCSALKAHMMNHHCKSSPVPLC